MTQHRLRPCTAADHPKILTIINAAAQRYRGAIPDDCWRKPYMPSEELETQVAEGVAFSGLEIEGELVAVMGLQRVDDVDLIRHAYVAPGWQGRGLGGTLLEQLKAQSLPKLLVGTWAAATWAVGFYQAHGFRLLPQDEAEALLRRYWRIPDRQAEVSVVLARAS